MTWKVRYMIVSVILFCAVVVAAFICGFDLGKVTYVSPSYDEPDLVLTHEDICGEYDCPLSADTQRELARACETFSLEPEVVLGLIEIASGFDASLVSDGDRIGLMQVPLDAVGTVNEFYGELLDLSKPEDNIWAGCLLLTDAIQDADGDLEKGIMAYKMGLEDAKLLWDNGGTSTVYSRSVLEAAETYAE